LPDDEYPLVLITGRQLEHWHTGALTRRASTLTALAPGATVSMHPATLARLALEPGERVRVESRRGVIELPARQDPRVPDGAVFIPFYDDGAAANLLTIAEIDPSGKIPEFKFCAVRVRPTR
jgi:formate dehydrogenase major subunit